MLDITTPIDAILVKQRQLERLKLKMANRNPPVFKKAKGSL